MTEILFLAHRAPWPPDRGDRIRSWHMLEALTRLAPVHIAALCDNDADAEVARAKLERLCQTVKIAVRRRSRPTAMLNALVRREPASVAMFAHRDLARHVGGLLRHGHVTHIVGFSSQMGQFIPPRSNFGGPVVMDFVDVDSAKFAAYADQDRAQPMHWVHQREARLLASYEAALARRADASLFVSEAEAALFRSRSGLGADRVHGLGNGIDTGRFDPTAAFSRLDARAAPLLVFTGQMDYRPNIDAVARFARDILPLVRQVHPATEFAIVGRAPTREVLTLADLPGVEVTGEVADVRPWLAAADVVVAPLLLARGIQNKLLEAMAMARPIVASPAAAEGIAAHDGEHFQVAASADAFANAINQLLADRVGAATVGTAARAHMRAHYSWEAQLAPLAGLLGLSR